MKLFITVVSLEKRTPNHVVTISVLGYRLMDSEDTARGSVTKAAMELKPGFSVTDVSVIAMPDEHVFAAADAIRKATTVGTVEP